MRSAMGFQVILQECISYRLCVMDAGQRSFCRHPVAEVPSALIEPLWACWHEPTGATAALQG